MFKHQDSLVYLDANSTTELSEEVGAAVLELLINNVYGNPSSLHEAGKKIDILMQTSRKAVSEALGCSPSEIIFTSGGTESNNLALRGIYSPFDQKDNGVVVSAAEHSSVANTISAMAEEGNVRVIPLLPDGNINLEWAERLITDDTTLVSVMLANNETGVIFPVAEIADLAHKHGAMLHCDAVQAFGKIPINVKELGADLLTISGHKAGALPGVGALYVRRGVLLHPLFSGGPHEQGLRPGTENYVGITTLGIVANRLSKEKKYHTSDLRDTLETGILRRINEVVINGVDTKRVPNTSSFTFKGVHAASLVELMNQSGVCISAGSACSSGQVKPSKTLLSMGLSEKDALSTVRISFGNHSTIEDLPVTIEALIRAVRILRQQTETK